MAAVLFTSFSVLKFQLVVAQRRAGYCVFQAPDQRGPEGKSVD
jgi:hypothetical protein